MNHPTPAWTVFDQEHPPLLPPGHGQVVALVASVGAMEEGWGPVMATELAAAWGASGHRVVLVDGGITTPSLHSAIGAENGEGLSDAVLFGVSVGRVARSVPGRRFFFVSAGTVVADSLAVCDHQRWQGMCRGFVEARATMVLFVPEDEAAATALLASATSVVVLSEPDAARLAHVEEADAPVIAVTGPDRSGETDGSGEAAASGDLAGPAGDDLAVAVADDLIAADADDLDAAAIGAIDAGGFGDLDVAGMGDLDLDPVSTDDVDPTSDVFDASDLSFESMAPATDSDHAVPAEASDSAAEGDEVFAAFEVDLPLEGAEATAVAGMDAEEDPEVEQDPEDPLFAAITPAEPEGSEQPSVGVSDAEALSEASPPPPAPAVHSRPVVHDVAALYDPRRVPTADEILAEAGDPPPGSKGSTLGKAVRRDRAKDKEGGRRSFLLWVLLGVLLAAAAAWWLGYVEIPGVVRPGENAPVVPTGLSVAEAAEPPPPPTLTAPAAPFSVALEAHRSAETAGQRLTALAAMVPDAAWTLAPVTVEGTLYHRVLVGPALDEVDAARLIGTVSEAAGLDGSVWVVRSTPLAFTLGDFETREEATGKTSAAIEDDVFAYVLVLDRSDGSVLFRVFAGGFADAEEADALAGQLADSGIDARLIRRTGRLPT